MQITVEASREMVILGAIASWFGGRTGTIDPTVTARFIRNVRVWDNRAV